MADRRSKPVTEKEKTRTTPPPPPPPTNVTIE
jgi:hypothetical protein